MWNEYFEPMLMLMVRAALLRASYELARPRSNNPAKHDNPGAGTDPNTAQLTPEQKEWAEKAVKKYAEVQERKWRRWNEAMFEKV